MKKLFVFAIMAVALTIFNGCQNENELIDQGVDAQLQEVIKPDVFVENGYLAFKNMQAVDSTINLLGKMTRLEKEEWELSMGFKSARSEFDLLFDEYSKLPTYEAFLLFKESNLEKLKFDNFDKNNCSIDYPFATRYFLPILNTEGVYKVGLSLIKYTKEDQIVILDGDFNKLISPLTYSEEDMVLQIPKLKDATISYFDNDNPNGTSDIWHMKSGINNRRINQQLWADTYVIWLSGNVYDCGIRINLNQRGQKKSWGRWKDYSTQYGIHSIRCKVGTLPEMEDVRVHISAELNSGPDFLLYTEGNLYSSPFYYSVPTVSLAAMVTFRGFGFDANDYYQIDYPDSYTVATSGAGPGSNWGW